MTHESKQPIHGNYHAYYNKRPNAYSPDPRLDLLPQDIFTGKRVLDVGCNEGWLTVDIAQRLSPTKIIGVDIDDSLITGAWKRRRTVWSLQEPPRKHAAPTIDETAAKLSTHGQKRKRMDTALSQTTQEMEPERGNPAYFPAALQHMFGPLPVPSKTQPNSAFPNNVAFYASDWLATSRDVDVDMAVNAGPQAATNAGIEREDREGYDVVIAFSLTKWIHLNGGDKGILAFFTKVHTVLRRGGLLLLEPQGWENYAKARKLTVALSETYKTLQLRPTDFPRILAEIGLKEEGSYAEPSHKRAILAFRKV